MFVVIVQICERVVGASWFRHFIILCILLAGLLVGLETYPQVMQDYGDWVYLLNSLVIAIFVVEIVIRILSHGTHWYRYFQDSWNIFDFSIVAVCLLPLQAHFVQVFRLVRVLRVLRLVTALPRLQMLVGALLKSLSSIGYITVLLLIHFYMYACLGTFLFGENDPFHFGTLHASMLSLFQVVTLEGWVDVMNIQLYGSHIFEIAHLHMQPVQSYASPVLAPLYFVSFILFGTMIVLNLFIGVILSGMNEMQLEHSARELARKRAEGSLTLADELHLIMSDLQNLNEQMKLIRKRLDMHMK